MGTGSGRDQTVCFFRKFCENVFSSENFALIRGWAGNRLERVVVSNVHQSVINLCRNVLIKDSSFKSFATGRIYKVRD